MPRGGLYARNPRAWFALRDRLRAAGRWYGDQQRQQQGDEPPAQVARTEGATDVHTTPVPTAVTGLDEVSLYDLIAEPDWGLDSIEYDAYDDTTRSENLHTPLSGDMSILRVGSNESCAREVRTNPQNYQPQCSASSGLSGSGSLAITVRNSRAANSKTVYSICPPCHHQHVWPLSVYDTSDEGAAGEDSDCEIHNQLSRAHPVYYTKQRNVTICPESATDGDLQRNIRCNQERMAVMGLYDYSHPGVANMLWLNESKFSDINEQEYNSILSRFQFFTSYALICAAQKKPFEGMSTGCCNIDLAINVFHTFMDVLKPEWAFATWENSKENVLHLHLCFQHTGRIDTAKKKLLNLPQYEDATLTTIKLERTRSFTNLFRYYMKDPIVVLSTDLTLLNASLYALNNRLGWVDGIKKPTPIADVVLEIMQRHKVNTIPQMMEKEPDMMRSLLQTPNLQTIIDNCRTFIAATQPKRSLLAQIDPQQVCDPRRVHTVLVTQHIDVKEFDSDFYNWITQGHAKKNTFILHGPSNTGKSCFVRPLISMFKHGEITNSGNFMYQNCIDKEIIVWEQPLIGNAELEKFKLVSEGSATEVAIKFRAPEKLNRTPLLITTNHHIWRYCSSEEEALRNRCYVYNFGHVFRGDTTRSIQGNRCFCSGCSQRGDRTQPDWSSRGSSDSPQWSGDVGGDGTQHRRSVGGSGLGTPGRGELSSADRYEWEFVDIDADEPTGRNDDDGRDRGVGCASEQQCDGTGLAVGGGGATISDDTGSASSNRPGDPLEKRTRRQSWSPESSDLPYGRGHGDGHPELDRLQRDSPSSKRRRIIGRVVDTLGQDIGRFTGSSVYTQGLPSNTYSNVTLISTEPTLPIEAEHLVEEPIPNELNSVDWKCYLAYLRQNFTILC